jgi:hypothetical protein
MAETQFQVRKTALAETRSVTREAEPLAHGQVRVRMDRCAYTANNITYAAFGDAMHYWDFYPTGDAAWGCIPVWGFGDVVQSLHAGVAVGERLYGYWPTASHAVLTPTRLRAAGFADGTPHRVPLPAVYNQLLRCNADPLYTRETEDLQALLRPLFTTSWLIDDFLADKAFFGAPRVLLSSASSKTANATAALLHARGGVELVGLTSAGNRAYCERLGVYHRVLAYDDLETLAPEAAAVYVDFAGNGALRRRVHAHLPALAYSCSVGGTHVDQLAGARDLAGPKPVLFFAPAQVKQRLGDWGPEAFEQRLAEAWRAHLSRVTSGLAPWIQVVEHAAPAGLAALHAQVLAGRDDAAAGHVMVWGR